MSHFLPLHLVPFHHVLSARPLTPSYTPQYDDLQSTPGGATSEIPEPYKCLAYQGWDVSGQSALSRLDSATDPNRIVAGLRNRVTEGGSLPVITTKYAGSKTTSMDPLSFNYACVLNLQVTGEPIDCDIRVTATSAKTGTATMSQLFTYDTADIPSLTLAPMGFGTFDRSFKDVTELRFEVVSARVDVGAALVVVLDTFIYNVR